MNRLLRKWRHIEASRAGRALGAIARRLKATRFFTLSDAVTYSLLFSLFPFLIFLVALIGFFIDPRDIDALLGQLAQIAPRPVIAILDERLNALAASKNVQLITASAAVSLFSASSGVVSLLEALDRIFEVEETSPFWKTRLLCLLATLGMAGFALVATLIALFTPLLLSWVNLGPLEATVRLLSLPVAGLLIAFAYGILLRLLPNLSARFRVLSPGALLAVAFWMALSWGFSAYVQHLGRYEITYGALGGFIVLLLWLKYSVVAFLIGAAINAELYRPKVPPPHASTRVANTAPRAPRS